MLRPVLVLVLVSGDGRAWPVEGVQAARWYLPGQQFAPDAAEKLLVHECGRGEATNSRSLPVVCRIRGQRR